jgi:hypothetical protein
MPKHYIGKTGKAREIALEEHKASGFKMKSPLLADPRKAPGREKRKKRFV